MVRWPALFPQPPKGSAQLETEESSGARGRVGWGKGLKGGFIFLHFPHTLSLLTSVLAASPQCPSGLPPF